MKPVDNQTSHVGSDDAGSDAVVTSLPSAEWSIAATRHQGSDSATATVIVRTSPTPAVPAPHAEVAAAQAWLVLARRAADASVFADAIAAARQGITALGNEYRPKLAKDDTAIKIAMADDSIAKNDLAGGAASLVAALDSRIYMYFVRYADAVRRAGP